MNEITVHGNITAQPVLRRGQSGAVFLTFTVAVNRLEAGDVAVSLRFATALVTKRTADRARISGPAGSSRVRLYADSDPITGKRPDPTVRYSTRSPDRPEPTGV